MWAAERLTGMPVFLEDGQAVQLRPRAKVELRCPVPDCENDKITTVNGNGRRRDHFRHDGGGGHSDGEGVFHLQAKAMLASWLRTSYPDLTVREEECQRSSKSRPVALFEM